MIADKVNSVFELGSGLLSILNVIAVYKDKEVRGVSIIPQTFFFVWGLWNLYYYPHLSQWYSFLGGIVIVIVNALWVALAIYYTYDREENDSRSRH